MAARCLALSLWLTVKEGVQALKRYAFGTRDNFELIDLHDSPIMSVSVTQAEIVLELRFANLLAGHPRNPFEVAKCMKPVVLGFYGVVDSRPGVR